MAKRKIAVFSTGWASEILAEYLEGLRQAFKGHDIDMFLFLNYSTIDEIEDIKRVELDIFRLPELKYYDGAVIFGNAIDYPSEVEKLVARCKKANIPVVCHGVDIDGTYKVLSDNYIGMKELTEHLIQKHNVKKINFISGAAENMDAQIRLRAVSDAMEANGLSFSECDDVFYTNWEVNRSYNHAASLSQNNKLPDAILCANDELAMGACLALRDNNVKVPEDVIVTGFDNILRARIFYPSIASVDQFFTKHGYESGRILIDVLDGVKRDMVSNIACGFVPGESCGCFEDGNSTELRKVAGTDSFSDNVYHMVAGRHYNSISRAILSCSSYGEIRNRLAEVMNADHSIEGDNIHILIDPEKLRSQVSHTTKVIRQGKSIKLDVIFSMKDGKVLDYKDFDIKYLIPGYQDSDPEHMYVFVPLHTQNKIVGYIVFCDCFKQIHTRDLHEYYNNFNQAFEKFIQNEYLQYMNDRLVEVAQIDSLTHVKNRSAYDNKESQLMKKLLGGTLQKFGLIMFDINNLKQINDKFGHNAGDEYILNSCKLICRIFKHSPIYRMGGDEFLVILENSDYDQKDELLKQFRKELEDIKAEWDDLAPVNRISIASGIAVFTPETDSSVEDVYRRADTLMYINKKEMKSDQSHK